MTDNVITKIKLNKLYTQNWWYLEKILPQFCTKLPQEKKGDVARFRIDKPLPTQDEMTALVAKYYTTSAEGLISDANSEIEDLKTEVEEWKDNIEENFSGTEKYNQLEEAYDQLENYSELEWPSEIEDFEIVYIPPVPKMFRGRITQSRASRLEEACDKLQVVMDCLEDHKTEVVEKLRKLLEDLEDVERTDEQRQQFCDENGITGDESPDDLESAIDDFIGEIENNKSEVEGVEFPGMFG